jgi:hypothetical protein
VKWLSHILLVSARRAARAWIRHDAEVLLVGHGEQAYPEARERARRGRERLDRSDARHWTKVAVEIARRTGREVGVSTADRYLKR